MKLPKNLSFLDSEFNSIIDIVYSRAKDILNSPIHLHYTDHSTEHSERILSVIDKLVGDEEFLSDEEKFILVCAVILHDIGMQTPNYADLGTLPLDMDALEKIRVKHHEFSEKMIIDSVDLNFSDRYYLGLDSKREFVDDIALVAKYHRKLDINILGDDVIGDKIIRLKLLSSLIRLGDCLDIDFRRVRIDRLKIFPISTESKFFWFGHHYVKGLTIINRCIQIYFNFPDDYKNDSLLTGQIMQHIQDEIANQIDRVYSYLDHYGIRLYKDIIVTTQYSKTTVQKMPNDLVDYINKLYSAPSVYRGVIYGKLNIKNKDDLVNAYYESLKNTTSFRNMLMGPNFLSPIWYKDRKNTEIRHEDFDGAFYDFIRNHSAEGINENIKIIFRNTSRYSEKVKSILTPSEYKPFFEGVLANIFEIWGEHGEIGPLLCCVDPGYMHIITSSDHCAIITQRAGSNEATHHGYLTADLIEISRINMNFDDIFYYNYTSQQEELGKLISFIHSLTD